MEIDITFRNVNATEAATILVAAKDGGASLALFFATPGAPAMQAGPAAAAAVPFRAPDPLTAAGPSPSQAPPAAAQTAQPPAQPAQVAGPPGNIAAPDFLAFSRAPSVKAVVKALLDSGVTDAAAVLSRCLELRGQGVPALAAVPEDQLADRVAGSLAALQG